MKIKYFFQYLACAGVFGMIAYCQPVTKSALSAPIRSLAIDQNHFDQALAAVVRQSAAGFVVGFEPAAEGTDPSQRIQLRMTDTTVGQALSAICASDRRYTFSESRLGVIDVKPVHEIPELEAILDLPVAGLDLQLREWPWNLFTKLPEHVPELAAYLNGKSLDWAKMNGKPLPGTPGVIMSTNVSPPEISLRIGPTTVRGALDSFAAYTLEHTTEKTAAVYLAPIGWRVDFTPDKQAPTGLGGYLKWSVFP